MNTIIFKKQDLKNIHNIKKENIKCFENKTCKKKGVIAFKK
jgi:hypothetical protein